MTVATQATDRFDALLEWASELSGGSWSQWRETCRELGVDPTPAMQDLAALGHVEIGWSTDRFSCPPPTAAFLYHSSGSVLLTGARPRGLLDRLAVLESELVDALDFFVHAPTVQVGGPRTVLIEAELDDIDELCAAAGLEYVFDPAGRIAERLPEATLARVAHRESWPPRDDVPRRLFDPRTFRFAPAAGDCDGLWWYDGYRREEAWIRTRECWWQVPTREYAPYLAHPDAVFLRYDPNLRQLTVPQPVPLPPLQARCATLASGRLPRRARSPRGVTAVLYENISPQLAERIATSLGTPLGRTA